MNISFTKAINNIRLGRNNIIYRFRYYNISNTEQKTNKTCLIFLFKEAYTHPGLSDRLKAIVGAYYIAKCKKTPFKIFFDKDLDLSKFIVPNQYDWCISECEIKKSIFNSRLLNYTSNFDFKPKNSLQYHIINYYGNNHKDLDNNKQLWAQLFNELFKPSDYLLTALKSQRYFTEKYVAVHFRFVNSFELLEVNYPTRPLSEEKQSKLEMQCLDLLHKIENEQKKPVLVFSDSPHFIQLIKLHNFNTIDGDLGHISYNSGQDVLLKTFVDWFMISRADKIYSVVNNCLYVSAFPSRGAIISGKTCERITIDDIN